MPDTLHAASIRKRKPGHPATRPPCTLPDGYHQQDLFTFLHRLDVPYDNNFGERQIRPAVILRKNSQCNHSQKGAATQAVLMSVYQTLKLRGLNPLNTIVYALRTYTETGQLPPLPAGNTARG